MSPAMRCPHILFAALGRRRVRPRRSRPPRRSTKPHRHDPGPREREVKVKPRSADRRASRSRRSSSTVASSSWSRRTRRCAPKRCAASATCRSKSTKRRAPRAPSGSSGLELNEAIKLYEGLLAAYPNYERNDTVMYQLSRAYEAQAQPEKALAVLDRLVAKYPQQPVVHRSRSSVAAKSCSAPAAIATPSGVRGGDAPGADSGFYEQGLYKHGWSLFKQSRGEESVASFLQVLDRVLVERRQAARARFARRVRSAS